MKLNDLLREKPHFQDLLKHGQLHDAYAMLTGISESLLNWEVTDKIKIAEKSYSLMLDYAMKGAEDSNRTDFIEGIKEELNTLYNYIIIKQKLSENTYEILIEKLRNIQHSSQTLREILDDYEDSLPELNKNKELKDILEKEQQIFYYIWTSLALTEPDKNKLEELFLDEKTTSNLKNYILGALLLHLLTVNVNSEIIVIFLNLYEKSVELEWKIKSLTCAVLGIMNFGDNLRSIRLKKQLQHINAISDNRLEQDIQDIVIEIIKTKETDNINKKLNEDIIPSMMKLGPQIKERLKNLDEEGFNSLEENPEWKQVFEDSGIQDKLEELNRLQQEGADVLIGSFGNLKMFPFFNEVHNWFAPFSDKRPEVADFLKQNKILRQLVNTSTVMCDSDRYSFVFSFAQLPIMQQEQSINALNEQFKSIDGIINNNIETPQYIANRYIKNLYRFFRFYRRNSEFINPFTKIPVPQHVELLKPFTDKEYFSLKVAEFYFRNKIWDDALTIYRFIETHYKVNISIFQKIGYILQKQGNFEEALNYYMQAELMGDESSWILHKIAHCSRVLGKWALSIEYYDKLEKDNPQDIKISVAIGDCYMELKEYDKAVKYFFKANYLDPSSSKILRKLTRALLYKGELDAATHQAEKLLETKANSEDFQLMALISFMKKEYEKSVNYYVKAVQKFKGESNDLFNLILNDLKKISQNNIDREFFGLLLEKVKYSL